MFETRHLSKTAGTRWHQFFYKKQQKILFFYLLPRLGFFLVFEINGDLSNQFLDEKKVLYSLAFYRQNIKKIYKKIGTLNAKTNRFKLILVDFWVVVIWLRKIVFLVI